MINFIFILNSNHSSVPATKKKINSIGVETRAHIFEVASKFNFYVVRSVLDYNDRLSLGASRIERPYFRTRMFPTLLL